MDLLFAERCLFLLCHHVAKSTCRGCVVSPHRNTFFNLGQPSLWCKSETHHILSVAVLESKPQRRQLNAFQVTQSYFLKISAANGPSSLRIFTLSPIRRRHQRANCLACATFPSFPFFFPAASTGTREGLRKLSAPHPLLASTCPVAP